MHNPHPSAETIEQYAMNRLAEPDLGVFEEHLLICRQCQEELERTDEFVRAAKVAARKIEAQPRPGAQLAFMFQPPALVATFAALVLALFFFVPRTQLAPQAVALTTFRGSSGAVGSAGAPLDLRLDLSGLTGNANMNVKIVDDKGSTVESKDAAVSNETLSLRAKPLSAGHYWVRLFSGSRLLREYGLEVR